LAVQAGFPDAGATVISAIAIAESDGDPEAVGDRHLGVSCGLTQVNLRWHPEWNKLGVDICEPLTNLRAAFQISNGGTDFKPWSTYSSGAYKKFMPTAPVDPDSTQG
jgi:hypothetical protein